MSLSHAQIRAAVDGIDAVAQIEVRTWPNFERSSECVAIVVESARDLVAFGMSLAYVAASEDGEDDAIRAIDDAVSTWGRPRVQSLVGEKPVAYWPAVPVDPEVGP